MYKRVLIMIRSEPAIHFLIEICKIYLTIYFEWCTFILQTEIDDPDMPDQTYKRL